jgi:hypothetical protein
LKITQEAHELLQKALALPENEQAELVGNLIAGLDATASLRPREKHVSAPQIRGRRTVFCVRRVIC